MAHIEQYQVWWDEILKTQNDESYRELWIKIKFHIRGIINQEDRAIEISCLKEMAAEYGGCCILCTKVEWEGLGYFYNSYTTVPASFDTYAEFCASHDGVCWCGSCGDKCDCVHPDDCECSNCEFERYVPEKDYNSVKPMLWLIREFEYDTCTELKRKFAEETDPSSDEYCIDVYNDYYPDMIDYGVYKGFLTNPNCWCGKCKHQMSFIPLTQKWIQNHQDGRYRLMHFNVLADQLALDGCFKNVNDSDLEWDVRKNRLLDLIKTTNPDILSIVECDHYDDFWQPELTSLGYNWMQISRKKNTTKTHGVALFIKPIFTVQDVFHLDTMVAALGVKLLHQETGQEFDVVNTHLKAKSKESIRIEQVRLLIGKCQDFFEMDQYPLIVTGDLNSGPVDECIQQIVNSLNVTSRYPITWTTWKDRFSSDWQSGGLTKKIEDYILTKGLEVTGYLDVPADEEVIQSGLLPGSRYPSDHLAIAIEFK